VTDRLILDSCVSECDNDVTDVGGSVAIKINGSRRDDRVERILRDPKGYFARARQEARVEVKREMEREQQLSRGRAAPA
jgi:hypothetical protein